MTTTLTITIQAHIIQTTIPNAEDTRPLRPTLPKTVTAAIMTTTTITATVITTVIMTVTTIAVTIVRLPDITRAMRAVIISIGAEAGVVVKKAEVAIAATTIVLGTTKSQGITK